MRPVWNGIAVDLGASSGRVLWGKYDGNQLTLEEIHRFENEPVWVKNTLYWDILRIYHEIKQGIRKANLTVIKTGQVISSIGIDSWAVDFGLLDESGQLLGNPVHYRDQRNEGMMEKVFALVPKEEIFRKSGIQFMPFNTIYQLTALINAKDPQFEQASTLLMLPDLLHYFMTGQKLTEFTNATSTQLLDPNLGGWSEDLIGRSGIPRHLFTSIIQPGTIIGDLLPALKDELGFSHLSPKVIAVATHDTGSAIAAVPSSSASFAYISCGTWSLLGTELKKPVLSDRALELNFTNEGGVEGTFRLLKNIMGLWLLQETKREWERHGRKLTWSEMTEMTTQSQPFAMFIDPDDARFMAPGDMPGRIRDYCKETGQQIPQSDGEILRCVTESLSLKYRWALERLEELTERSMEVVHMVGGGIQNELLCQWTAEACCRPVISGPIEASGLGNIIVQLITAGEVSSIAQARELIAASFPMKTYKPQEPDQWQAAFERFEKLL
ncbi:MAG TPA: rhamnulokinase [Bacilli bacterium]